MRRPQARGDMLRLPQRKAAFSRCNTELGDHSGILPESCIKPA
jgi:hypothetical protein